MQKRMRGKYAGYELSTVRVSMFSLFFRLLIFDFLSPFFSSFLSYLRPSDDSSYLPSALSFHLTRTSQS